MYQLVPAVVEQLAGPYPELTETVDRVQSVIKEEESGALGIIERGIPRVERLVQEAIKNGDKKLDGRQVADLKQTHGVPPSVAESVAEQNGIVLDWEGYEKAEKEHEEISNDDEKTVMGDAGPLDDIKRVVKSTTFVGYSSVKETSEVCGLVTETLSIEKVTNQKTNEVKEKEVVQHSRTTEVKVDDSAHCQMIVLRQTPFYGESGGQVGDVGWIIGQNGKFQVTDTQKDLSLIHI